MVKREKLRSLKEGQRVTLRYERERRGTIRITGPEVSEVKFDDGSFRYIANRHLIRLIRKPILR